MSELTAITTVLLLIFCVTFCQAQQCDPNMSHRTYPMPDKNPLLFYICPHTDTPFVIKCPKNSGFIATNKIHGCVNFVNWPHAPKDRIPKCTQGIHQRLYRHIDPSRYFACKSVDTPVIVKCNPGEGFTYTSNKVGCVPWNQWVLNDQINDDPVDV